MGSPAYSAYCVGKKPTTNPPPNELSSLTAFQCTEGRKRALPRVGDLQGAGLTNGWGSVCWPVSLVRSHPDPQSQTFAKRIEVQPDVRSDARVVELVNHPSCIHNDWWLPAQHLPCQGRGFDPLLD